MRLNTQTYVLTAVTHQRRRIFQRTATAELFIETLFRYRDSGKFKLHGFVVMPEHIHVMFTPGDDIAMERCVQHIKGGFSFAVREEFKGEVWQEGYHAHRVTDPDDFRNQLLYIANNPTRKHYEDYPHVHTAPPYASRLDP